MIQSADNTPNKFDYLLPVILLILPLLMVLLPLVIEVRPRVALYYTPFLVKIFLFTLIFYAIATNARHGRSRPVGRYYRVLSLVLVAIVIYSTAFRAQNISYSFEKVLDIVSIIFAAYFVTNLFERSGIVLIRQSLLAIFCSITLAIPVVAMLFHFRIPAHDLWPNFLPGFVFVRIYGFSLTVAISIGIGLLVVPKFQNLKMTALLSSGLILLWTTLFWTSSRAGIFSIIVVLPVIFILFPSARKPILLGIIFMCVGAALSSLIPAQSDAYGFFQAFDDTFKATSVDRLSTGRLEIWRLILGFISDFPLLGHGYGQTTIIVEGTMIPHAHVHNIVLEAALAWGWVGALCASGLILPAWLAALQKARKSMHPELVPAILLITVLAVYAWLDGVYFYYHSLIPLAVCAAVLRAKITSEK